MTSRSALNAQVVQTTSDVHNRIRESLGRVPKLVFGNATNLDPGNRMLYTHPHPGELPVVAFLARRQFPVLGLFFGCKLCPTRGE